MTDIDTEMDPDDTLLFVQEEEGEADVKEWCKKVCEKVVSIYQKGDFASVLTFLAVSPSGTLGTFMQYMQAQGGLDELVEASQTTLSQYSALACVLFIPVRTVDASEHHVEGVHAHIEVSRRDPTNRLWLFLHGNAEEIRGATLSSEGKFYLLSRDVAPS